MNSHLYGLALSDTHILAATGLAPKEFRSSTGNYYLLNDYQKYLYECWQHMLENLPPQLDFLILNGDIVEGRQPAQLALELTDQHPLFQGKAAVKLLEPLVERVDGPIIMARGTEYHVGDAGMFEEFVGEQIGAEESGGYRAQLWPKFFLGNVYFDVHHEQSYTIRYRSMPLEREVAFMAERYGKDRRAMPETIVMIRSHTHVGYKLWCEDGIYAISTPAFKLPDSYAKGGKTPNRMVPENIGAVGIYIFDEPFMGRRVHIDKRFIYDRPKEELPQYHVETDTGLHDAGHGGRSRK